MNSAQMLHIFPQKGPENLDELYSYSIFKPLDRLCGLVVRVCD
jgi:hypothetical protein